VNQQNQDERTFIREAMDRLLAGKATASALFSRSYGEVTSSSL
jgi:hypothetical protein